MFWGERADSAAQVPSLCGRVALPSQCLVTIWSPGVVVFRFSTRSVRSMNVPVLGAGVQVGVHTVSVDSSILATGDVPVLPHEF